MEAKLHDVSASCQRWRVDVTEKRTALFPALDHLHWDKLQARCELPGLPQSLIWHLPSRRFLHLHLVLRSNKHKPMQVQQGWGHVIPLSSAQWLRTPPKVVQVAMQSARSASKLKRDDMASLANCLSRTSFGRNIFLLHIIHTGTACSTRRRSLG